MKNIYDITDVLVKGTKEEYFEILEKNDNLKIERIVSTGQISNEWYDQDSDELVFLLQGEASIQFEDNSEQLNLKSGDYFKIKAHKKHKVIFTSQEPPCIWLAIHSNFN